MAKKIKFNYSFNLKKLCTPAMIYFVLSAIGMFLLGLQNLNGENNILCVGTYKCGIANKLIVFLLNAIYILFWTFVLDLFCKAGYKELSWFIVLIPFILYFLFLGLIIFQSQI